MPHTTNKKKRFKTAYWFAMGVMPVTVFYWIWKVSKMLAEHEKEKVRKNEKKKKERYFPEFPSVG